MTTKKELTTGQKTVRNEIVSIMMQQLGGTKFLAITGSKPEYKDISTSSPIICFKLTKNSSTCNYFKLQYMNGSDLYKLDFIKIRKENVDVLHTYDNIYGDQLQDIFTEVTGLHTTL